MTDAVLLVGDIATDPNTFYLTHFMAHDPVIVLRADGRTVLVTSEMEKGRAEKETRNTRVRTFEEFDFRTLLRETGSRHRAFTTVVTRLIQDAQIDGVSVRPTFPVLSADGLRAAGVGVRVVPDLLDDERRAKTAEEIAAIEEAQRATERAVARAVEILRASENHHGILHYDAMPLTSERLRTEMELSLMRDGMEPSGLIVAGGPGAADPHWAGEGPLRVGEAIVIDIFPRSQRLRYHTDMTRTFVKGTPSDLLRSM